MVVLECRFLRLIIMSGSSWIPVVSHPDSQKAEVSIPHAFTDRCEDKSMVFGIILTWV